jgi:hypothetical protein
VFPKNIAVCKDRSILVTNPLIRHLYLIPHCLTKTSEVTPIPLLHFKELPIGIVKIEPNVFYIIISTLFNFESPKTLWRIDFNGFTFPISTLKPEPIIESPPKACFLNGSAILSPTVVLCANSFTNLI